MTAVALIFAGLASLLHVLFFKLESLDWRKPKTWKTFGLESQADADTTASLAYNQGFYNLFLAVGAATGVGLIAFCDTKDTVGLDVDHLHLFQHARGFAGAASRRASRTLALPRSKADRP